MPGQSSESGTPSTTEDAVYSAIHRVRPSAAASWGAPKLPRGMGLEKFGYRKFQMIRATNHFKQIGEPPY